MPRRCGQIVWARRRHRGGTASLQLRISTATRCPRPPSWSTLRQPLSKSPARAVLPGLAHQVVAGLSLPSMKRKGSKFDVLRDVQRRDKRLDDVTAVRRPSGVAPASPNNASAGGASGSAAAVSSTYSRGARCWESCGIASRNPRSAGASGRGLPPSTTQHLNAASRHVVGKRLDALELVDRLHLRRGGVTTALPTAPSWWLMAWARAWTTAGCCRPPRPRSAPAA